MNLKIAVVGGGYWGKNLIRNFSELGALHTICDNDEKKLEEHGELYPEVNLEVEFENVLKNKEVNGIVISTPAINHYKMAKTALTVGKDVFVEKPLSLDVNEGRELIEIAKNNNKILMVGHILNYHPAIIKLKELIKDGELGKILYIYSNRLNLGKFRTEENILWSFAPHDISVILMLLNEFPHRIASHGGTYLNKDVVDVTLTNLDFPSGVKAHIFVSWLHPYKEQKLVVVGSNKMAVFDDVSDEKLLLYPHEIEWVDRIPVPHLREAETVEIEMKEPLNEECKHFLASIKSRKKPKTDGEEGLRVLKILQSCQESLEKNGEIIYFAKNVFAHPTAIIDPDCEIGDNTKIWHFSHVMPKSKIGEKCNIGQNVVIAPNVIVGNGVKIQNNVSIYDGVIIEDDVFLGPSVVFTNIINPRSFISRKNEFKQTLIKKGATIGANTTIICGNTIGKYAFIGAGSVVTKNVLDHALVYGVPAQFKGWICKCGTKLNSKGNKIKCIDCGREYLIVEADDKKQLRRIHP